MDNLNNSGMNAIVSSLQDFYFKHIKYEIYPNYILIALPIYINSNISINIFVEEKQDKYILTNNLVGVLEMNCEKYLGGNYLRKYNILDYIVQNKKLCNEVSYVFENEGIKLSPDFRKEICKSKLEETTIGIEIVNYAEAFKKLFEATYYSTRFSSRLMQNVKFILKSFFEYMIPEKKTETPNVPKKSILLNSDLDEKILRFISENILKLYRKKVVNL